MPTDPPGLCDDDEVLLTIRRAIARHRGIDPAEAIVAAIRVKDALATDGWTVIRAAEVARLREDNQRLARFLREAKDAREDEIRADDEGAIQDQLLVIRQQAVEALNEALYADRDRLAGVIERIRAKVSELIQREREHAGHGRDGHLTQDDLDEILDLLPPAPTDGTNTTDDTPETT